MMSKDLTIAVLSWGAHKTLINTLSSYKTFGIDETASQRIIWFQEISNTDKDIARKYGYEAYGSKENIGIAQAYKNLTEIATKKLFLFLENDWVALEGPQAIDDAYFLIHDAWIDVARLRHRKYPGAPLWTFQFKGNEMERPTHLLDSVHWLEHPDKEFPNIIHAEQNRDGWYWASAANANWTNNPTMFNTDWLRRTVVPFLGNRDIEVDLQSRWEQMSSIVVGQGPGIFTHRRIG